MEIYNLVLGSFETNCYCLRAKESDTDCIIIDTGLNSEPLIEFLKAHNLNPVAIIFTHGHADHIYGLNLLRENYPDIETAIHKDDADMLTNSNINLSLLAGVTFTSEPADKILNEGDNIEYAGIKFEVIHTPGHTPGGICLYNEDEKLLFAGDTLFAGSIGRTDFPGGDYNQLIRGIKEKLFVLPEETKVYTGHGPVTTIANEKKYNPFTK